ncbi:phage tail-like protein [Actinoplanes campanulatus]|uniref:Phage tail protein n=1 Tax=Actinoplanes campanulatus TaxID=113559 RepID=A0A7W5AM70_9ACTN|nr:MULTISPECIES: phage tail protein [Actinoplanes]MBB3098602.1 phage tail-like protein [Actinoplanes campanulatus]GGN36084.1 phage tail protein [Actinoplanes campanulatus]GID39293.1 phage tail protein [Actinoplanes campanulatus]GID48387.1 phage tail protein [Actinoplanes capillaceus]
MYPLSTLHFVVDWGDQERGTTSFSEVSGLTLEAEVIEYRGGADLQFSTHKQPGLRKFSNVTLKRGIAPAEAGNGLFQWYNSITVGAVERRDVSISLLNEVSEPVMTWKIKAAWPVKLEGPGLKSTGTDVAIESLEFACEGIEIETR